MAIDVTGIDHLYISVRDLSVSEAFYDRVMRLLGFRKRISPVAGEPHVHYFNRVMQYTLRPARAGTSAADPYAVGSLHHLCFQVADRSMVDAAHNGLRELGIEVTEPRLYPDYRPDYYASFFRDPDGVRLEVVCDTNRRRMIRERWDELDEFVNPVEALLARAESEARPEIGNLFDVEAPSSGESFESLATFGRTVIERIVSSNEPGSELYVQEQDEWVVLLRGVARLEIAGRTCTLRAGDHVALPAHTPHRVLATSTGATWLAVHVHPPTAADSPVSVPGS